MGPLPAADVFNSPGSADLRDWACLFGFFWRRIFLAGAKPSISETPRRSRVSFSALNVEHEKEEARLGNDRKA